MLTKWFWPKNTPRTLTEVWLGCQVLALTSALRSLLNWVKLPRLLHWLTPAKVSATPDPSLFSIVARYVGSMLCRFPSNPRGSCLIRSLSLYYFGRRYGYPVQFHCGVCRTDGELKGHAWLSLNGEPFWEPGDPFGTHVVTFSYPPNYEGDGSPGPISPDDRLIPRSSLSPESDPDWPVEHSVGFDIRERS